MVSENTKRGLQVSVAALLSDISNTSSLHVTNNECLLLDGVERVSTYIFKTFTKQVHVQAE